MDGGVAVHSQDQGFFHMPKLMVPNYQKPRVYVPFNQNVPPPNMQQGGGGHIDLRMKAPSGTTLSMPMNSSGETGGVQFDGKRMRKAVVRKTVDYNTSVIKYLENRIWQRDWRDARAIQPDALYQLDVTPPCNMQQKPMNCLTTKFMRQSTNKFRCPIFCLAWTPEGRRLVTGASSGEFTLWNGLTFSFETILQAHETSVRAMRWSHNDQWMVTGDHAGYLKYWQSNMNNVKMYQGHKEAIRDLRWEFFTAHFGTMQLCCKIFIPCVLSQLLHLLHYGKRMLTLFVTKQSCLYSFTQVSLCGNIKIQHEGVIKIFYKKSLQILCLTIMALYDSTLKILFEGTIKTLWKFFYLTKCTVDLTYLKYKWLASIVKSKVIAGYLWKSQHSIVFEKATYLGYIFLIYLFLVWAIKATSSFINCLYVLLCL